MGPLSAVSERALMMTPFDHGGCGAVAYGFDNPVGIGM